MTNYVNGWKGFGRITFATFFANSFYITILSTIGTTISSALVAYAFCGFPSKAKKFGSPAC
jgi:multiple sugar transport system permease protein